MDRQEPNLEKLEHKQKKDLPEDLQKAQVKYKNTTQCFLVEYFIYQVPLHV